MNQVATGIHPFNANKVIDKIPETVNDPRPTVNGTFFTTVTRKSFWAKQAKNAVEKKEDKCGRILDIHNETPENEDVTLIMEIEEVECLQN
ncbi:hypothetical protein ILUMI_09864 [Ignelater luminosus]|uniref:Uncharacterized protein n=1 Tax=Ignelater luminosus TaxID=2038154 RepID=A0A8K0D3C5_IGNLU|nr:hypothetical protein ILUMI_09864 [Ignelater luminosus]